MCKLPSRVLLLVCLFIFPALASADSLATVNVSASLIGSENFGTGPFAFLTGQFTLDEDTKVISVWSMTITVTGATYQLSSHSGGVATAICDFAGLPCPYPALVPFSTNPGWTFSFADGGTAISMDTLYNSALPFFPGETLQLCPLQNTFYPGNAIPAVSPPCAFTSHATFNNQIGYAYELENNSSSSGILTVSSVVSTPEATESSMLLLGAVLIFALRHFAKIKKPTSIPAV